MITSFAHFRIAVFALLSSFLLAPSLAGHAQNTSKLPDSCDATFMTQIKNRASAEASRDLTLAQTAIRKPDSVLEYVCFSQFVEMTANQGAALFSDSTHWDSKAIDISTGDQHHSPDPYEVETITYLPDTNMDRALQNVVLDTLAAQDGNNSTGFGVENFGHDLLGGLLRIQNAPRDGLSYYCTAMGDVWNFAKCDVFLSEDKFTNIGTFDDIRRLPQQCQNGTGYEGLEISAPADTLDTYLEEYDWEAPDVTKCDAQTGILTGRMVRAVKDVETTIGGTTNVLEETYAERTCLLPGCYYNHTEEKCQD